MEGGSSKSDYPSVFLLVHYLLYCSLIDILMVHHTFLSPLRRILHKSFLLWTSLWSLMDPPFKSSTQRSSVSFLVRLPSAFTFCPLYWTTSMTFVVSYWLRLSHVSLPSSLLVSFLPRIPYWPTGTDFVEVVDDVDTEGPIMLVETIRSVSWTTWV